MADFQRKPGLRTFTQEREAGTSGHTTRRHALFFSAVLLSLAVYYSPLKELMRLSLHDVSYSHIPLMPILAGFFLYVKRGPIFSRVEYSFPQGALCMGFGGILYASDFAGLFSLSRSDHLSLAIFSALLVWTGAFIASYGLRTFGRALFPFSLLLFVIPLPGFLTRPIVVLLQKASAETVHWVLKGLGIPMTRDGYVFHFSGTSIKIAEECAGFHSFLGLLATGMIAARLFLLKGWSRTIAVISVVPISIAKNTLRIVVISLIVVYMGENAFVAAFHRLVGFSFFALLLLWPVVASLMKLEARTSVEGGRQHHTIGEA